MKLFCHERMAGGMKRNLGASSGAGERQLTLKTNRLRMSRYVVRQGGCERRFQRLIGFVPKFGDAFEHWACNLYPNAYVVGRCPVRHLERKQGADEEALTVKNAQIVALLNPPGARLCGQGGNSIWPAKRQLKLFGEVIYAAMLADGHGVGLSRLTLKLRCKGAPKVRPAD